MPITTVPLVDELPEEPSITDPANFEAEADGFLGGLPDFRVSLNGSITAFNTATGEFTEFAEDTEAALAAMLSSAGFLGTSASSVAIGSGTKTFATQTDLSYRNSWVLVSDAADPANYVYGKSTYNPTTGQLVVTVAGDGFGGSGTKTAWTVELAGPPGEGVALASAAEVLAGTDTAKAVSPKSLADSLAPIVATVTGGQTPDCSNSKIFKWLLSGNITLNAPSATLDGASIFFRLKQPPSGGPYTLSRNVAVKKGTDVNLTLSTGADKVDMVAGMVIDGVLEIYGITKDITS